jgi:energy-coupling factor transporter ATP-binding protein EcfA2
MDGLPRADDLFDYAAEREGAAAPLFHPAALEELLSEARDNEARATGPMQHVAITGERGSGKSFLVHSFAGRLHAAGIRGRVVLLPGFRPQIQTPHDVLMAIHAAVGKGDPGQSWEETAAKLDALFSTRSRSRRLLVVVAENYTGLIRRAFPAHGDQARLRNWLDRPESRVMLVTTATEAEVDNEPGAPLFGFLNAIRLGGVPLAAAEDLFALLPAERLGATGARLARFLFLASNRTARAANAVALALDRHGAGNPSAVVREILRYHAEGYDEMLDDLGQRAGVCMQDMILNGEPITQSELARRIGLRQQSAVAQPFSEMRRKYLLREDPAPHSAAKYAAFADRFLVSHVRRSLPGPAADPLARLAGALAAPPALGVDEAAALAATLAGEGRARAFALVAARLDRLVDGAAALALAVALVAALDDPDLLGDCAGALADHDALAGALLENAAAAVAKGRGAAARRAWLQPDLRAAIEAIRPAG